MDILFGEINKTYKYYLRNGSLITITQIGGEVKIYLAENWVIKFKKFIDDVSLTICDGDAPYYTSTSKKNAISPPDDTPPRAHPPPPPPPLLVNLLDEIMKPDPEIIPIVQERKL